MTYHWSERLIDKQQLLQKRTGQKGQENSTCRIISMHGFGFWTSGN